MTISKPSKRTDYRLSNLQRRGNLSESCNQLEISISSVVKQRVRVVPDDLSIADHLCVQATASLKLSLVSEIRNTKTVRQTNGSAMNKRNNNNLALQLKRHVCFGNERDLNKQV